MPELNVDVLDSIITYLTPADMAATSSVCRSWVGLSQRWLYRRILFDDDFHDWERMVKLADTLNKCHHLHHHIRVLNISFRGHIVDSHVHYQWLRLLPSPSLIHTMIIADRCNDGLAHLQFISALFGCPALPTIKHLALDGVQTSPISRLMILPLLESLQLGPWLNKRGHVSHIPLSLERLSVNVYTYETDIRSIVRSLRYSLTAFHLDMDHWEQRNAEPGDIPAKLTRDLSSLTPLKHLTISHTKLQSSSATPFMDDVKEHLPQLETLYCCSGTSTGRLFERIPGTLHSLRIETTLPFIREISRLCARKQEGAVSLQLLELGSFHEDDICRQLRQDSPLELVNRCAAVGITLGRLEVEYWYASEVLDCYSACYATRNR